MRRSWSLWLRAAGIRCLRVSAAAMVGVLTASAVWSTVDWSVVFSAGALAAVIEFLVCVANLPEAPFPGVLFHNGDHPDDAVGE